MDIVKVFGTNLKNIELQWASRKKLLRTNVECIVHISVHLNAIAGAYHLKMFSELRMH